jgi:ribosomal protein S18 acetylase RimI-like enzyme
MIIQTVENEEIEELADLAGRVFSDSFGHSFTKKELESVIKSSRSPEYFRKALNEGIILVAIIDGKIVGYVQFGSVKIPEIEPSTDIGELGRVYIETKLQGQGIGEKLSKAALKHPELKNKGTIYLQVWEENIKAINLYKKLGFKLHGRTKFKIGDKTDAEDLIMRLDQ